MKNKRGQGVFGMSFSTIFSVFLIAVFIVVAFLAIKYFLDLQKCSEIGLFKDDFQKAIDDAYQSPLTSKTDPGFIRSLPSGIEYVCFANLAELATGSSMEREIYDELRKNADYTANLFFYPQKKACIRSTNIDYINMTELTNPYCFSVEQGKVEIKIEKGYSDHLVRVFR